ncbi:hypothetical protein [Actinopolyspora halophila]|uniref:hypothetical protein n=1 Tax=Actinopolyspora halophila TaxID=1850 RepID=UPI0003743D8B|nr:hypothetical protein [Actinopolyspora halophila]
MSYHATITGNRNRHLIIQETHMGAIVNTIAAPRLTAGPKGVGTWGEVADHLAEHGLTAQGWKFLRGAGELRAELDEIPAPEPEPAPCLDNGLFGFRLTGEPEPESGALFGISA